LRCIHGNCKQYPQITVAGCKGLRLSRLGNTRASYTDCQRAKQHHWSENQTNAPLSFSTQLQGEEKDRITRHKWKWTG